MGATHSFDAELWRWRLEAEGTWIFLSLPFEVADEIEAAAGPTRGFGSVRVEVTIGSVTWRTSLFPSKARKTYVLPVKAAVRKTHGLAEGDTVSVSLVLIEVG